MEIANAESLVTIGAIINYISDNKSWKSFSIVSDKELSDKDPKLICKIKKLDPRDRPTANELLHDEWFDESDETFDPPTHHPEIPCSRSTELSI